MREKYEKGGVQINCMCACYWSPIRCYITRNIFAVKVTTTVLIKRSLFFYPKNQKLSKIKKLSQHSVSQQRVWWQKVYHENTQQFKNGTMKKLKAPFLRKLQTKTP